MLQTPRTFSHIGLSVPHLDAAVKFYSEVLGFYTIMLPTDVSEDDSDIGVCAPTSWAQAGDICALHISRRRTGLDLNCLK
jgi:catechol 2,3-dioxygenase-like lactoylglutathione lyase family enzyme